ncbi:MAG TPA: NADH-quinone oxidoreductase subunit A [Planctomycetota bacterium]|jgi:NADH-quinone oxidoreductase subunit A|nr:NADH-quinone oxidoreductase subunit A [Planctomycetota bacterium]
MTSAIDSYVPLMLHLAVVTAAVLALLLASTLLGPKRPTRPKSLPYESGSETPGGARQRFTVRFYLVAMLFILFDVETVFLFAWAVSARALGMAGFATVALFVGVLGLGLAYAWRKGALAWDIRE